MKAIDEARRLIESRVAELDKERDQLLQALESLSPKSNGGKTRAEHRSRPRRRTRTAAKHEAGKRAPRGQRQKQFVSELSTHPGATMTEIARRMGVSPQQLYPIARRLESSGSIVRSDKGYIPAKSETNGAQPASTVTAAS